MLFHLYNRDYFLLIFIHIGEINIQLLLTKKMKLTLFLDIHMFAKSCLTLCTCTTIALLETRLHYAIFYTLFSGAVHLAIPAKQLKAIYYIIIHGIENLPITFKKVKSE